MRFTFHSPLTPTCLVRQVVEVYSRDIFQAVAEGVGVGEGNDVFRPLLPTSPVNKILSFKDRSIVHPAPMEEDTSEGVPDAKVWARVQATVRLCCADELRHFVVFRQFILGTRPICDG